MSVRSAKRRIRTAGMTIPRLMIGDCVLLVDYIGYVGKYEFKIIFGCIWDLAFVEKKTL